MAGHLRHLDEVLRIMESQSLFSKRSKCKFRMTQILYLGHIISVEGVQVHQEKIQPILDWLPPKMLSNLHEFHGLCSYYKRFVKKFSQLSAPLIDLTKKGSFHWDIKSEHTFDKLKEVMSLCLVLTLPILIFPSSWSVMLHKKVSG